MTRATLNSLSIAVCLGLWTSMAAAVLVPDRNAPPETGALVKAASGAIEMEPLVRVINLARDLEELKKVELLDERDQARERAEEEAREQAELDAIGMMRNGARA